MASTRLPGKPLADIHGRPMVAHVVERAREADVGPVVVACCEDAVYRAARACGATAVMTRADHASGSDRIYEALRAIDPERRHDAVINVQGDLPTVERATVRAVFDPLGEDGVDIATLIAEIRDPDEADNPNVVKAVVAIPAGGRGGRALYFSRARIPTGPGPLYHHIGLYGFRTEALERFVALPPGILEAREKLEQLRALEAGMRIEAVRVDTVPLGVDTPADLERARRMLDTK
ncbi:3-deoxy-manno-octulosonate cytidylyltransferase [Varunaivibrio sulfuroxidans]|uniref:3-deoxy-manno-octulosonate cytidylyltransferase (CMP-KDO synthetase) n=2 Tax=Varunaivibrio sulfuroxidans TaxID=1773489 RepID=A0A4R3JI32_9PROT|nr:3-deoxy-manno-octulosonate cytidylyltransferase [Varunaivibrio sulfuroxidans]TCS65033.1 3-deoxy-manno-octulosonate cytidylyltransferase (CMP-KDO synthetase) [Varunaivibrio sulfuroxidans]WES32203.1 3-deoxy-manno-octulosonate cytidylyltransferase [Varunaivibrio sulfuroxidans]